MNTPIPGFTFYRSATLFATSSTQERYSDALGEISRSLEELRSINERELSEQHGTEMKVEFVSISHTIAGTSGVNALAVIHIYKKN